MKWRTATLAAIVKRSPTVSSFFLDLPEPLSFVPGQHVDIRLTAPDGYRAQRSYSIASAPEAAGPIELAIEKLDDGEVSPFFHEIAAVGDEIELRGPVGGHFNWNVDDGGPVLLIGGGSGLVPLLSMLRHRIARTSRVPMALVFSVRTRADFLFRAELEAYAARNDGFGLIVTLTRDSEPGSQSHTRRIDREMVAQALSLLPALPVQVLVCGSNAFVGAAADAAIAAGVPTDRIKTERYGN
jgi:ferredoxin-NADP reductase